MYSIYIINIINCMVRYGLAVFAFCPNVPRNTCVEGYVFLVLILESSVIF